MSRSNRKIKTLFKLWTWLKKDATMDAVLDDRDAGEISVISVDRWVPLRNEAGEVQTAISEWGGHEYTVKILQPIPEHELKANLAQYIYQLQYTSASERDEGGMSLVKKARKESKSAGKREIAGQIQEMEDDFWQRAEEDGWEEFYRVQQHWPVDKNSWVAKARARTQKIGGEVVKSWEDKAFYDKNPSSRRDFWERCDPRFGCSFCGGEECNDDYWPGMNLVYRDFLLYGTTLDWDYDPEYDEIFHDESHRFQSYGDKVEFYYNAPTLNEMWDEQEEIVRCNRYIDRMDLAIEMMHHENDLCWDAWEDDDWNEFFPGYKEPLEDTEKRRLVHAERRRRTYLPVS